MYKRQAPRHTFSRGDNSLPTTKHTPETNTSSRRWWCFFSFGSVLLTPYVQNTRKLTFSNCGWCYFQSHFRGRHSKVLEVQGVELSPIFRRTKKMTKIEAENRVRNVTRCLHFRETHPHDYFKKTGRETLPLAIPQVELHSQLHEKRNFDRCSWFSAQQSILSWFWPDFVIRFGWPSITYLILV